MIATEYDKKVKRAYFLTLWGLFGFIAVLAYTCLVMPPLGRAPNAIVFLLQLSPLLLVVVGLFRGQYRAYLWLCFILMLYFLFAVNNAATPDYGRLAYIELAFIVECFVSAMLYARWRQRQLQARQLDAQQEQPGEASASDN